MGDSPTLGSGRRRRLIKMDDQPSSDPHLRRLSRLSGTSEGLKLYRFKSDPEQLAKFSNSVNDSSMSQLSNSSLGSLSQSIGTFRREEKTREKIEAEKRDNFLVPETYCDNCGLLAAAVLDWKTKHKTKPKKDEFAIKVAKDKVRLTPAKIMEELKAELEGLDLIRGAARWICHFIQGVPSDNAVPKRERFDWKKIQQEATTILTARKAGSYEFAVLFAAMMEAVEIPCMIVRGVARHSAHKTEKHVSAANHCWNIVRLPGVWTWRFVDVAMCSGSWSDGTMLHFSDAFFLSHPQQFIWHHFPIDCWCAKEFELQIGDMSRLQLLVPQIDRKSFWSWPLVSTSLVEGGVFVHPKDFTGVRSQEKSTMLVELACTYPAEFEARMTNISKNHVFNECITVRHASAALERTETGVGMFKLRAAFPEAGTYQIELLSRLVSSNTYKKHELYKFTVVTSSGVFNHYDDPNLLIGYVRNAEILQEQIRNIVRNTLVVHPEDAFHFVRNPYNIALLTPPEVTRVAYVSNVFWCFLDYQEKGGKRKYSSKVLIDRRGSFAAYFEVDGRFVRAVEFRGITKSLKEVEDVKALKSSYRSGKGFLWDIKDVEKQKKVHKAITKRDGDLDMDQYGRCIGAELQIKRITKESFTTIFDLRSKKGWMLQAVCFSGWHSKSVPLPAHFISVDLLKRVRTPGDMSSPRSQHYHWQVTLKIPPEKGDGSRFSIQFNLSLNDSAMFRYAMTYYHTVKVGPPSIESFEF